MNIYVSIAIALYFVIGAILGYMVANSNNLDEEVDKENFSNPIVYNRIFWFIIMTLFWIALVKGIKWNRKKSLKTVIDSEIKISKE